jgi:precorrin-6B methylase 2
LVLRAGARCVDIGCGGGHVAIELARRVGRSGSVLGIDLDEALLDVTHQNAVAQNLPNLEFRVAAAGDLAEAHVDLAYSRLGPRY